MKKIKACFNSSCSEYCKKKYKENAKYCTQCGEQLHFICKHHNCKKQLPDDTISAYCLAHEAEHKDKKDETAKDAGKAGALAMGLASAAVVVVKQVKNIITKSK